MLLDKRFNQQALVEDYRACIQESQAWFEHMAKSLESLEASSSGLGVEKRLEKVAELAAECEEKTPVLTSSSAEKAEAVAKEVGEMDRQHVQEQAASVERRAADIKRRIERKRQILEMAHAGYADTKGEIESTDRWMKEKTAFLMKEGPHEDPEKRLREVAALTKEIEAKSMLLESLENKAQTIRSDLGPEEGDQLQAYLKMLSTNHGILTKLAKEVLKREKQTNEDRKRVDDDVGLVATWLKAKSSELGLTAAAGEDFDPLRAFALEQKAAKLKKAESELKNYEESSMSKLRKNIKSLTKSAEQEGDEQPALLKELKELEASFEDFKSKLKSKTKRVEEKVEPRRKFESELESCTQWLAKAEAAMSSAEMRGSSTVNIATLDEHLQKFRALKKEEDETRELLGHLVDQANEMLPTLSDADRLTLRSQMDEACDKMNKVAEAAGRKVDDLVKNIDRYRRTASRIEESVSHLGEIQREIKLLNRPIGHRVEDAEEVLRAYEKILADLKKFKDQLEELHRTAGTNVNELRALLQQQQELILAIENQMVKIRSLIGVRHSFMELVTGITGFIIKYTEVVKEVERSSLPSSEKAKRYEEVLEKIGECEAQLAAAFDKGEQIAAEGSSQDRNKITEQLQSLKSQIQTLKRAIEKKRAEHVQSAADHERLVGEVEKLLDALSAREGEVRSRPLLGTGVDDVEKKLSEHEELASEVRASLDRVAKLRDEAAKEDNLPGSVANVLNQANALLHTLPLELNERKRYLEGNKEKRLQYDSLVERLNTWVEEAQLKLRPYESGVDFQNLESELDEHKKYFSQETKLRDLLDKIHDTANKIWASLDEADKDKMGHEQEFFNQLVKNTLNSAHSKQAEMEDHLKKWKKFRQLHAKAKEAVTSLGEVEADPDRPTSLAAVKVAISRADAAARRAQQARTEALSPYLDACRESSSVADVVSRARLAEESEGLSSSLRRAQDALSARKERLASLALQWDDLEQKQRGLASAVAGCQHRFAEVDTTYRSLPQMKEIKTQLKVLLILGLSNCVIMPPLVDGKNLQSLSGVVRFSSY